MTTPDNLPALLRHLRHAGIYHLPTSGRAALKAASATVGFDYIECDLAETDDLDIALARIGRSLGFPDWYGNNLDALNDCLTDLSWRDTPDTVLLLSGCDELRAGQPEAFDTLLEVFSTAIEFWKTEHHPFWVFIDMRADGIATLPTIA